MRFEVEAVINSGISMIRIEHEGDHLIFSAGNYSSAAIIRREHLFDELNEYLAAWSDERQDRLWDIYRRIYVNLYEAQGINTDTLTKNLSVLVQEVYKVATYDNLKTFVYRANLRYPTDLSDTFQEYGDRGRNYRERTYIKSEYTELVALALGLRFMLPIWGKYIQQIVGQNGNYYKETEAVDLLEVAGVKDWPPYVRMDEYVSASIDSEASLSTLYGGLSSEEIPEHLLALAIVRKIAIGPLSVQNDKESLARILFNYVTGTNNRLDTRFMGNAGPIQQKKMRLNDNEDDNSSVWDMMTQTQEVTDGEIAVIEIYTENLDVLIERTCPELSMSRVQQCISAVSKNEARIIPWWQKAMMVWICRTISPEARELLSKKAVLRLLGLCQAALDHWGFPDLAVLVAAEKIEDENFFIPNELRNKITADQTRILNEQYPYYRQETKRLDPTKRKNEAIKAIDMVVEAMMKSPWKPLAPRDIIEKNPSLPVMGYMTPPGNIRIQLANMIIHVNNLIKGN